MGDFEHREIPTPASVGRASVEIYKPVGAGWNFAYRVVATAVDDSEQSLRAAKALALSLEQELFEELKERRAQRLRKPSSD